MPGAILRAPSGILGDLTDGFDYDKARDASLHWCKGFTNLGYNDDDRAPDQALRRSPIGTSCTARAGLHRVSLL